MTPFWRTELERLSAEEATQRVRGRPALVLNEGGEAVERIAFSAVGEGEARGLWVLEAVMGPYRRLRFYPFGRVLFVDLNAPPARLPEGDL